MSVMGYFRYVLFTSKQCIHYFSCVYRLYLFPPNFAWIYLYALYHIPYMVVISLKSTGWNWRVPAFHMICSTSSYSCKGLRYQILRRKHWKATAKYFGQALITISEICTGGFMTTPISIVLIVRLVLWVFGTSMGYTTWDTKPWGRMGAWRHTAGAARGLRFIPSSPCWSLLDHDIGLDVPSC